MGHALDSPPSVSTGVLGPGLLQGGAPAALGVQDGSFQGGGASQPSLQPRPNPRSAHSPWEGHGSVLLD